VAKGKRLQHDSTHVVKEWQEGVDGSINRWDIEAPRPKLTFAEAWADRKQFTPLYLLKLYSPTFTGYGSYELNSVLTLAIAHEECVLLTLRVLLMMISQLRVLG
jgi:hypothetical protein